MTAPPPPETGEGLGLRLAFAGSSMALVAVLVLCAFVDESAEWRSYQKEYRAAALTYETSPVMRSVIKEMPIEIRQQYLPGLDRIDRCTTCHIGVEDPNMAAEEQPLTTHSGDLLLHHPPDQFGCTVCHGGQGLATFTADAHGEVPHWSEPLRQGLRIQASCGVCHRAGDLEGADQLNSGQYLFRRHGCVGCHRIGRRGQHIGPDLTRIARRDMTADHRVDEEDWEWHIEHLVDPTATNPDSFMPDYGLDEEQASDLTTYLHTLTDQQIDESYILPASRPLVPATRVGLGREVYDEYGCAGCHGPVGEGGYPNLNSQSGGQVSGITKVKQGYSRKELIQTLEEGIHTAKQDPEGPDPPLIMPAWLDLIPPDQLDYLVDYLFSLAPEEADWDDWDE